MTGRETEQSPLGQLDRGQHTFRDMLVAIVEFPLTMKRMVDALERQNFELANLTEVGQDFNRGFYELFGGKVSYHPRIHQDDILDGLGKSDGASLISPSFLKSLALSLKLRLLR